jgi:hypothetical protein
MRDVIENDCNAEVKMMGVKRRCGIRDESHRK